jgi:hypothetical protein
MVQSKVRFFMSNLWTVSDLARAVISICVAVNLATRFRNSRGYVSALFFVPYIAGSILVNCLPSHDRVGLLVSYWTNRNSFHR